MLVSKTKPCMSKYKLGYTTVKLRMAHYISYNLLDRSLSVAAMLLAVTWITLVILELIHATRKGQASSFCWVLHLLDTIAKPTFPKERALVSHNN